MRALRVLVRERPLISRRAQDATRLGALDMVQKANAVLRTRAVRTWAVWKPERVQVMGHSVRVHCTHFCIQHLRAQMRTER